MTYDELQSLVTSYTIRDDFPFANMVFRAETYLRSVTKHYLSETTAVLPITANVVTLPADFIEIRAITGTSKKTYKPVSPTAAALFCDEVGYYRSGNTFVFVGTPDDAVTILYSAAFPSISPTQSNWLLDRFPNVYVSSVLKEFYRWEKDSEGVAIETAALNEALGVVAQDDKRGTVTGPIIMEQRSW